MFSKTGLSIEKREGNRLELIPETPDFDLKVTGFDTNRDLVIKALAEEAEE